VSGLAIESRRVADVAVVVLRGEARLEAVEPLRLEGRALLADGVRYLLLDLGALSFADSASVGTILDLARDAERKGGGIALFGATKRLARMLDGLGLLGRLRLVADEADARRTLGAS